LYDLDNPLEPDVLAAAIIESLEGGLNSFREILNGLGGEDVA
jgi:type I restriction enzyme M protein